MKFVANLQHCQLCCLTLIIKDKLIIHYLHTAQAFQVIRNINKTHCYVPSKQVGVVVGCIVLYIVLYSIHILQPNIAVVHNL